MKLSELLPTLGEVRIEVFKFELDEDNPELIYTGEACYMTEFEDLYVLPGGIYPSQYERYSLVIEVE